MLKQIKRRIENIADEVKELHPILEELFNNHPEISRVEYTHGPGEMGADFVLTYTHRLLGTPEHVGVVAKRGSLDVSLDVVRQIDQCTSIRRKIDGGKREVTLSEVWVICTGNITRDARERIYSKYPGTNVQFSDGGMLASMVHEHVPSYAASIGLVERERELALREEEGKLRELASNHRGRATADEREAKNVDKARETIVSGEEDHCPTCHRGFDHGEQEEITDTLKR